MHRILHNDRGSAILVALALVVMLSGIGILAMNRAQTDSNLSFNQVHYDQAFWLADAGAQRAIAQIKDSVEWRTGYASQSLGNGEYSVSVTDSSSDTSLAERVRIIALGQQGEAAGGVEVIMGPESYHPLYDHAIYAGNYIEYDSTVDTQTYTHTMEFGGSGLDGDDINGDIHHNGHINTTGNASIDGTADAGGNYTGTAPTGGSTNGAAYLEPPDLQAMNYESNSDYYVNSGSPFDGSGRIASTDPRHIFVKDYRSDLDPSGGSSGSFTFDNENYFFGDPWESSDISNVSVDPSGNNKTYFIDGNLWIEPGGTTSRLISSPPEGTHITVVVKGNIYFSDNLLYDRPAVDGLAFVAMTDGESFDDLDGNNQYDAGEPILRDDGDGVYEGPMEGSGNVFFGDPNGGPLGHVHGFLYADNNFEDHVLDATGTPLDFEISGTMSAGNQLKIQRDLSGGSHAQMKVNHDTRLRDGTLNLPGLPGRDGNVATMIVLSWREL